jgi:superfamily II DNA or RNA helicase
MKKSTTEKEINVETSLPLRDYQIQSVREIMEAWSTHKNILLQQPTGAGKSLIIAAIIELFINQNKPVLLVAHKVELIRQLQQHCQRWFPQIDIGIIGNKTQFKRNENALIQIASIQAFNYLKIPQYPPASLVIFDEAHHCHARSYAKLFTYYEDSEILGVTATPVRLDGKGLKTLHDGVKGFENLITGVAVKELINQGYLSQFRFYTPTKLLDPKQAGIHTKMGDYVPSELEAYTRKTLIYGDIIKTYKRHAKGLRTVVYPVSVAYSQELCQKFIKAGYPAEHLDSKTPTKEREQILERFRQGETLILCQHSIVIEGVDVPEIGAVIFARPTKSITIWFQAIGRSLRPSEHKEYAVIIDHTTTHQYLPFPDCEIDWNLEETRLPEITHHGVSCPKCRHYYHLNQEELTQKISRCPSCRTKYAVLHCYQDNSFYLKKIVKKKDELQLKVEKVVEVIPSPIEYYETYPLNSSIMGFFNYHIYHAKYLRQTPLWVYEQYQKAVLNGQLPLGLNELKALARKLNYQEGWAVYKYQELSQQLAFRHIRR